MQMTSPRLLHQAQPSLRLHHVESREANNMPEGICGTGIRDLNGVVHAAPTGHGVAPLDSKPHTGC